MQTCTKSKSLILYQPQNGYCYNSDTHFLFDFINKNLKIYKNIKGELLDIGSGSGVLGLLIARDYPKLILNQCEIQKDFQFLSQKNSDVNGIKNILFKDDLLNCDFKKQFDYIVSNPPFYHSDVIKSENRSLKIARYNDSLPLEKFIYKTAKILKQGGKFFFCYDSKQLNNIIKSIDKTTLNIESIQFLHPTIEKESSLVMVYARVGSKSKLKIIPPLIMFNSDGEFTTKVNEIYSLCSTHSIKCII
ncbi:MAG: methyltransferase [Campylobacterota bacterium]|nr:methyltransferase [Campylobacterota bacterium]